jgi:perosamine synthetase
MTFKPEKWIGVGDFIISKYEKKYLQKVIDSNRLSYGPMSRAFESKFSQMHQTKYGIFCNSGTSALQIALAALKEVHGWQDDDEVIVPALTFIATSNIVLYNKLKPVFVDIELDTYNLDPKKILEKITPKTKCIIPVHLFGQPCTMDPIMEIARSHSLRVIEDSCETMFANYKGKPVGTFGDIACFSTYIAHFIVTGIGGFCLTSDPELEMILRSLMNHGRDPIYFNIDDGDGNDEAEFEEVVSQRLNMNEIVRLGHSFRASEFEAAVGLGQLEQADKIVRKRREIAKYYKHELASLDELLILPQTNQDRDHNFMMFPIVIKDGSPKTKEEIVLFLENNKIETRDILPLLNQPIYKKLYGDIENQYPVAEFIRKKGFYIGSHQYITDEERAYVVEKLKEAFE